MQPEMKLRFNKPKVKSLILSLLGYPILARPHTVDIARDRSTFVLASSGISVRDDAEGGDKPCQAQTKSWCFSQDWIGPYFKSRYCQESFNVSA